MVSVALEGEQTMSLLPKRPSGSPALSAASVQHRIFGMSTILFVATVCGVSGRLLLDKSSFHTATDVVEVCCNYGSASYAGFWAIPAFLYMHNTLTSPCQMRPFAMQLGHLSNGHTIPAGERDPVDDVLDIPVEQFLAPIGWSQNFSIGTWLTSASPTALDFLNDQVLVVIGDSLDRFVFASMCRKMEAITMHVDDRRFTVADATGGFRNDWRPRACRSLANNFTVIALHHYGVLNARFPTTMVSNPLNTKVVVDEVLPNMLDFLSLKVSDISMIQVYSALWDIHNKAESFQWSMAVQHAHWMPLMREQLMDPIVELVRASDSGVAPLVVVRTAPPERGPGQSIAEVNEGLRAIAMEYSTRLPIRLLDMAVVLASREGWLYDNMHYPRYTSLQHANLLLNMLHEWKSTRIHC